MRAGRTLRRAVHRRDLKPRTYFQASSHHWRAFMCSDEVKASEALQKRPYYSKIMRLWISSFTSCWGKPHEQAQRGRLARQGQSQRPAAPALRTGAEPQGSRALPREEQSQTCPRTSQASSAWEPGGTKPEQEPVRRLAGSRSWAGRGRSTPGFVAALHGVPAGELALVPLNDLYTANSCTSLLHNSYLFSRR